MDWLKATQVLNNSIYEWIVSGAVFFIVFSGLATARSIVKRRLKRWAAVVDSDFRDLMYQLMRATLFFTLFVFALVVSASFLTLSHKVEKTLSSALVLSLLIQFIFWGNQVIEFALRKFSRKRELMAGGPDPAITTILPIARFLARLILYVVLLLLALDNLGVNITALLAGLGVGGIAVALAVQNILGDLFASLSIVLDKPFEVGDTIQVGTSTGSVERIGLKTTRIRSVTGEQLIFSNANLLGSQIQNFKRMNERRQIFSVGVVYETPIEKIRELPKIFQNIVEAQKGVRFESAHFTTLGDFSLNFQIVYYVLSSERKVALDIQQQINFEIIEILSKMQIQFAYPTQTIQLAKS
jgi:small-conductance mechanosensitive channel